MFGKWVLQETDFGRLVFGEMGVQESGFTVNKFGILDDYRLTHALSSYQTVQNINNGLLNANYIGAPFFIKSV